VGGTRKVALSPMEIETLRCFLDSAVTMKEAVRALGVTSSTIRSRAIGALSFLCFAHGFEWLGGTSTSDIHAGADFADVKGLLDKT
jgi:hypothetical protein